MPLLSHDSASVGRVGEEMEAVGGVQIGMGVGVCPHAVEQRAKRTMQASVCPVIRLNIQLSAMVLLFLSRVTGHAQIKRVNQGKRREQGTKSRRFTEDNRRSSRRENLKETVFAWLGPRLLQGILFSACCRTRPRS